MKNELEKLAPNSREVVENVLKKGNYSEDFQNTLINYFAVDSNINKTFGYLNGKELKIFYPIEHFEDLDAFIANDSQNNLYFIIKVDASRSKFLLEYGFNNLNYPFLISKIDMDIIKDISSNQPEVCSIKEKKFLDEWQLFNKYKEWYVLKRIETIKIDDDFSDPACFRDEYIDEFISISESDEDVLFSNEMKRYFQCEFDFINSSFKTEVFKEVCIKRYNSLQKQ